MPIPPKESILTAAIWRFSLEGLEIPTKKIAQHALVSVGSLFRLFPTKDALLLACYEYASTQLAAPLQADAGQAPGPERLKAQLQCWWLLSAQVALDRPSLFDFWRLYRTRPRLADRPAPLLGPFAPVPDLVERALARRANASQRIEPFTPVGASLAGQWTAAVDLVLSDPACQANPALQLPILERAYLSWWQSLGLSEFTEAAPAAAVTGTRRQVPSVRSFVLQGITDLLSPSTAKPAAVDHSLPT